MRAKEFIIERTGMHEIDPTQKAALNRAMTFPGMNMNLGNGYVNYRFGIALAGAPDFPTKADNWIAGDPMLTPFTSEEADIINKAATMVGGGTAQEWATKRSEEMKDTNKSSPVAKPKRNKYGV